MQQGVKLLSLPISVKCQNGKGKKARTQHMRTHIIATGRTSERLPAMGGVHAHSHHRGWQNEPTIQDCQPWEECMRTHITEAGRMSPQSKIASRGRSACALTLPQLAERANNPRLPATGGVHVHSHHRGWLNEPTIQGCQPWEECMCTHITAAGRKREWLPATRGVRVHSHHRC